MTNVGASVAPEDRKGNLYRHSAEGLDDMPVSALFEAGPGSLADLNA